MTGDRNLNDIQAIIFDLGRVLIDVDLTKGIFKHTQEWRTKSETQILDALMDNSIYQEYACGRISAQEFYREIYERFGLELSFDQFKQEWNSVFLPISGMTELVEQLSSDFKIGLLSDIGPLHWEYLLEHLPVLKKIDKPTLSFQIGYLKPHPQTYLTAAANVGTAPEKCLFIDDREVNVRGALEAGMQAIRFENYEKLMQEIAQINII